MDTRGVNFVLLASAVLATLAGCAHVPTPDIVASSELGLVYRVRCEDTPSDCVASAKRQCADCARSLRNHSGRRWETPVFWLEFICAKPGEEIAEEDGPDAGWDPPPRRAEAQSEAEDAEARRRALQVLAAGLRGFAEGYSASTRVPHSPAPTGCTSDYACGIGFTCSKRMGSMFGECMRAVNRSGTPTFARDPSGHIGPGENQCASGCPPGFRCDLGRCIK
jgi:hypothetical protein